MFEILTALEIHVAWIPFAAEGRNSIDAPMNEDAELGVPVPVRYFVVLQGRPGWLKRPFMSCLIGLLKYGGSLAVELLDGSLPSQITGIRLLGRSGNCGQNGNEHDFRLHDL